MAVLLALCTFMIGIFTCHTQLIKVITCASNEDCTVSCSDSHSCADFIINCPSHTNCNVQCNGTETCKGITVNGPIHHELSIDCGGITSCFNATFNAPHASSLTIEGCQDDQSCLDLSIYCPPRHLNGSKNCFIEGNGNLGAYHEWRPMHIYARNGWLDIEIDYNGTFNHGSNSYFHAGVMHCSNASQYDMYCDMSVNAWSCRNPHDYCNNPTPLLLINTTSTTDETPPKKGFTINIDLDAILLPLILSTVLACCLIGACCVWYKILCVKSSKKAKKQPIPKPNAPVPLKVKDKSDPTVIRRVSQPASIASSHDSPALSSVVIHNMNNRCPPSIIQRHSTFDTVELQHANAAEHIKQNRHRYNISGPINAHNINKQWQHKKRESLSSLAPPSRQKRANRGSMSSRSRSAASGSDYHNHPFSVNDLEGCGIKDQAEYDPEGSVRGDGIDNKIIHHSELPESSIGDDIEDDDIQSELPESPRERPDENDSHSEIYLASSHHPGQTPVDCMSDIANKAMYDDEGSESAEQEGSGSEDMYINDNTPHQSPMGLPVIPQRVHKMSMDIATDVSVM
eukprot:274336_1